MSNEISGTPDSENKSRVLDKTIPMEDFASRLKELRKEKGLTFEQLEKATGINRASLNYWELRKNQPLLSNLIALAKFFNVSLDYIAGLKDD